MSEPFAPCSTCGHQPAGLAVEVSPIYRALLSVGSERGAIATAYKLAPDAPRDLLRAIVRWIRAASPDRGGPR